MEIKINIITIACIIFTTFGMVSLFLRIPDCLQDIKNNKLRLCIYILISIISIGIFISFVMNLNNKHLDSKFTYTEYPIEKITFQDVYFNGDNVQNLKESYVIIEEPNEKYSNIVIKEKEEYKRKWLFFYIKDYDITYHIYLTQDVYDRYKSGQILYLQK